MVVHLQDAAAASGAVVRAVRLLGLTFLAEAAGAGRLDRQRSVCARLGGGEGTVARIGAESGTGIGEDGGGIGPVEEYVEEDTYRGGYIA